MPVPTTATFGRIDEENGVDIEGSSFGGGIYIISRNVEGTTLYQLNPSNTTSFIDRSGDNM